MNILINDFLDTSDHGESSPLVTVTIDKTGVTSISGGDFVNTLSNTQTVIVEEATPSFESVFNELKITNVLLFILLAVYVFNLIFSS